MLSNGKVAKRCYCRDTHTGKQLGNTCRKLTQRNHGTWWFRQQLPTTADGKRRELRRSGYATAAEAQKDLDHARALLRIPDDDDLPGLRRIGDLLEAVGGNREPLPDLETTSQGFRAGRNLASRVTVAQWLDQWIAGRKISTAGIRRYQQDIDNHLKPAIGDIRLDRLTISHLANMFQHIVERNLATEEANFERRQAIAALKTIRSRTQRAIAKAHIAAMQPFGRTTGPASRKLIRATIRAALNAAIRQKLLSFNPAAHVEMDPAKRPKALLWTNARVVRYNDTGLKPSPVMVWTPAQTGQFLDFIADDQLFPLLHLIALRGLRRGEACGLRWEDVDFGEGTITVANQLTPQRIKTVAGEPGKREIVESTPKSEAGNRVVALDKESVAVLKAQRAKQNRCRLAAGGTWIDSGRVFTKPTGEPIHPERVSDRFDRLVHLSGLPPIRLHDLRHGAATIALAAGVDMKVIQEQLGHSSITLTADTYSSVLPELAVAAAEAAAAMLTPHRRRLGKLCAT